MEHRPAIAISQDVSGADLPAPRRGPSEYQGSGQYYKVLNHFFHDGIWVRRYARFKRLCAKKEGWGSPEWKEGLELDREFFYGLKIWECSARMDEAVKDGCEIVSYKKNPAPGGLVTYILTSWPSNATLERNRKARVHKKQPRQQSLPRDVTPFQPPSQTDWSTQLRVPSDKTGRALPPESLPPLFASLRTEGKKENT